MRKEKAGGVRKSDIARPDPSIPVLSIPADGRDLVCGIVIGEFHGREPGSFRSGGDKNEENE